MISTLQNTFQKVGINTVQLGSNTNTLPAINLIQRFDGTLSADGLEYVDKSSQSKNLKIVRNSCYLLQNAKNTTYPTQVNFDTDIVTIEAWYYRTTTSGSCWFGKFSTKGVYVYWQNSNNAGRISYRIFGSTASLAANADTGILIPVNTWTKVKFVIQNGVQNGLKVYLNDSEIPSFSGADTRSLGSINYDNKFVMSGLNASICKLTVKRNSDYNIFAPCAEGFGLTSYDISGNGNHGVHDTVTISNRNANSNYQDIYNYNNNNAIDVYDSSTYGYSGNTIAKPAKDLNGNAIAYVDLETALYGAYVPYYSTNLANKGIRRSDSLYKLQATTENIASDYQNFWFDTGGVAIARTWDEILGLKAKWFADRNTQNTIKTLAGYSVTQNPADIAKANKFCNNKTVELWIQAGESLAAASINGLSTVDPAWLGESYYAKVWNGSNFVPIDTNRSTHYYPGNVANPYYSTLFPFQKYRAHEGRECWFIHLGVGSSRIYQDAEQAFNWNVNTVGGSYSALKTLITNAVAWLDKYNIPYVFKGIIWQQGANDADATHAPAFKQNTKDFIAGIRAHVGSSIPFYIGETANYVSYATNIRAAQQEICSEVSNCIFIEDDGLPYSDNIHLDSTGKQLFAARVAARVN